MIGFIGNIRKLTQANADFRRVLYSESKIQVALMSVEPGQELGGEIHAGTDQLFFSESGKGRIMIDGVTHRVEVGSGIVMLADAHHNPVSTCHDALKLYTIYGPPHHADGLVQKTRAEADASKDSFEGRPTEQSAPVVQV